jgi:dTDP-D-glucose 4,6-dehydratase
MGKLTFAGKGQTSTVDHVNRIGFDNRIENLRVISQTEQNLNQSKKLRSIVLPEGCGIEPDSIPRHIWYVKASGGHGDRFAIEFKTEELLWRTTSSKTVPLTEKLEAAKAKLLEFYAVYPYLNPDNPEVVALHTSLRNSFTAIVALAS